MNITAYPANIPTLQFVDFDISTIDALDKGASIWIPATIVERPMDVDHLSVPKQIGKMQRLETL